MHLIFIRFIDFQFILANIRIRYTLTATLCFRKSQLIEPLAKCYEEVDIAGREREGEAYTMYAKISCERQLSRSAPQPFCEGFIFFGFQISKGLAEIVW